MGESCTMLLPPLRGGVEGRGGGVVGRCDIEVGNTGGRHSLTGCLPFLAFPRRSSVGDTGTGGSPMDFCTKTVNNQAKLDAGDVLTFGGVLGGGKLAFALHALSGSNRVIPDSSGGVDSMRGLIPPSTFKKRWSSEGIRGLEELLFGVRAGMEEGGTGDVCATSELLTADEGGNEVALVRA
jgi:hypothetical protein